MSCELTRASIRAIASASLFLVVCGCATSSVQRSAALYRRAAPVTIRVAPGREFATAEQVAAERQGDFALQGRGESMAPYLESGIAVVVHPTSYFLLRAGMPVVYLSRSGRQVAHVLVERREPGWVVIGLNNAQPDDEYVTPANLLGVIRYAFVGGASHAGSMAASEQAQSANSAIMLR